MLTDQRVHYCSTIDMGYRLPEWLVVVVVLKSAALAVLQCLFRQLTVLWHLALLHINVCRAVSLHS